MPWGSQGLCEVPGGRVHLGAGAGRRLCGCERIWQSAAAAVCLPGNPSPSQAEPPASPAPASAGEVVWFASSCSAWAYSRAALILLFFSLLLVLNWEVHSRSPEWVAHYLTWLFLYSSTISFNSSCQWLSVLSSVLVWVLVPSGTGEYRGLIFIY